MNHLLSILLTTWALVAGPSLCAGGLLSHDCNCEPEPASFDPVSACGDSHEEGHCGHECGCAGDPCGNAVSSVAKSQGRKCEVADNLPVASTVRIKTEIASAPILALSSGPPQPSVYGGLAFFPSDLPLLI